jgi:hypothetical protein
MTEPRKRYAEVGVGTGAAASRGGAIRSDPGPVVERYTDSVITDRGTVRGLLGAM